MAQRKQDVREAVATGNDVRPRAIALAISTSPATVYGWIARGEVEARRIGRVLVIPNHGARRLLEMESLSAA